MNGILIFFKEVIDYFSFKYEINCLYAFYILKINGFAAIEKKEFENAVNNFQKMLNLYELRKEIFKPNENGNNDFFYSKEFLNIFYNLSTAYMVK